MNTWEASRFGFAADRLGCNAFPARLIMDDEQVKRARSLSLPERQELCRLLKSAARYPIWLPLTSWFWAVFSMTALVTGRMDSFQFITFGFLIFVCFNTTVKAIEAKRLSADVRSDLDRGSVIRENEQGTEFERLPISNLVWTVSGEPAPWRATQNPVNSASVDSCLDV